MEEGGVTGIKHPAGANDDAGLVSEIAGVEFLCTSEGVIHRVGSDGLHRSRNMNVQNVGGGVKDNAVTLIISAELNKLKLKPAKGKSRKPEPADEPTGNEGAPNALDADALKKLPF